MSIKSINPFTNELISSYEEDSIDRINQKMIIADQSFQNWKNTSFEERSKLMKRIALLLKEKKQFLAELATKEMGKPISQSYAEVEKCAWVCNYYADHSPTYLKDKKIITDAKSSFVRYSPLGVVLAIMPWNYPYWQYFRFAAPNFMSGNVGVLKHASNVSGCSLAIEELFLDAGFPEGVSQSIVTSSKKIEAVIQNPIVKAVTLTGSEAAGSAVASQAGKEIKKTVLELGGTNAVIVFDDANLDEYLDVMVNARFQNAGQSCIAGKRFIVQEGIYDEFLERFGQKVKELKLQDPMDESCKISCMATESLAKELEEQMKSSLAKGAKIHLGGIRNGAKFEATILIDVTEDMSVFKEETFGPLAAISTFKTEEEAVKMNNSSHLGLGVSLFTQDMGRAENLIDLLDEGAVFINELVKSDPRLPFGGIKKSGYGRELSEIGNLEFMNRKTVYIK